MNFSEDFQKSVVSKYLNRGERSVESIAQDVGVSQASIYGWTKKYSNVQPMNNKSNRKPNDRPAQEKIQLVITYFSLPEEERGKFLRENGLHSDHLDQWKRTMEIGFNSITPKSNELTEEKRKNKALEKELRRKEKALAETAALLVLKKKADQIWGSKEDE